MGTYRITLKQVPAVLGQGISMRIKAMGDDPEYEEFRKACGNEGRPWDQEAASVTLAAMYVVISRDDRLGDHADHLVRAVIPGVLQEHFTTTWRSARSYIADRLVQHVDSVQASLPAESLSEDVSDRMILWTTAKEEMLSIWHPIVGALDVR